MSNVLIGIIGVILFIGLALAGALILGDDFKAATASSKASALVSQINQISNAINMYELKTGQKFPDVGSIAMLKPKYLSAGFTPDVSFVTRTYSGTGYRWTYTYVLLPPSQDAVCAQVQAIAGTGRDDGALNRTVQWGYGPPDGGKRPLDCVPYLGTDNTILYRMY